MGNIVCYPAGTAELGLRYEPSKMEGVKKARRKLDDKSLKCQFLDYEGARHIEGARRL